MKEGQRVVVIKTGQEGTIVRIKGDGIQVLFPNLTANWYKEADLEVLTGNLDFLQSDYSIKVRRVQTGDGFIVGTGNIAQRFGKRLVGRFGGRLIQTNPETDEWGFFDKLLNRHPDNEIAELVTKVFYGENF